MKLMSLGCAASPSSQCCPCCRVGCSRVLQQKPCWVMRDVPVRTMAPLNDALLSLMPATPSMETCGREASAPVTDMFTRTLWLPPSLEVTTSVLV